MSVASGVNPIPIMLGDAVMAAYGWVESASKKPYYIDLIHKRREKFHYSVSNSHLQSHDARQTP